MDASQAAFSRRSSTAETLFQNVLSSLFKLRCSRALVGETVQVEELLSLLEHEPPIYAWERRTVLTQGTHIYGPHHRRGCLCLALVQPS